MDMNNNNKYSNKGEWVFNNRGQTYKTSVTYAKNITNVTASAFLYDECAERGRLIPGIDEGARGYITGRRD